MVEKSNDSYLMFPVSEGQQCALMQNGFLVLIATAPTYCKVGMVPGGAKKYLVKGT